ncbi:MAG: hypothetical protein MZW92_43460 [Comamonadaceae bacterium]|nr:hypothetical protein [Comamonadaceae bacterium]
MPSPPPLDSPDTLPAEIATIGESRVRAVVWPTRGLTSRERWFDELYVWTEGQQPGTMQRARIQLDTLNKGFAHPRGGTGRARGGDAVVRHHRALPRPRHPGVRQPPPALPPDGDPGARPDRPHPLALPGAELPRLAAHAADPLGYRLTAPRIGMEMKAIDFVRPDFAKVLAPQSRRLEFWQDALLESRAAGLNPDWLIVAGIETAAQRELATAAGYRFAQGTAVKPCHAPPATRRSTLPWPGARDGAVEGSLA